jgi:hypothetical protein
MRNPRNRAKQLGCLIEALICMLLIGNTLASTSAGSISTGFTNSSQEEFDPEGDFGVYRKPPKGFGELGTILLYRGRRGFLNPRTALYTRSGVSYRFRTVTATRDNFTFNTTAVRGVSYSFTGKFLRGGSFVSSESGNSPVIEGQISKFRNGQKVAEARLKLVYEGISENEPN